MRKNKIDRTKWLQETARIWSSMIVYISAVVLLALLLAGPSPISHLLAETQNDEIRSAEIWPDENYIFTGLAELTDIEPPILFDPIPENNSYVAGGDKSLFIRVLDDNLNSSTVRLYIKSRESQSWDDYLMVCMVVNESTWRCEVYGVTLSLDIVGSDTTELYYFVANDTYNNFGSFGSGSHPLIFTVDINAPSVQFTKPQNNSYVNGAETVELNVIDVSSGVNDSTVKYSLDNSTWLSVSASAPSYTATWNTSGLSDNQSVILYAKASDNIGNIRYSWANVTVDNTQPLIEISKPSYNSTLAGVILVKINVSDIHSGLDTSSVYYYIEGYRRSMDCAKNIDGYVCDEYFNTRLVSDGQRTLAFYATDNAGNTNSTSTPIMIDNKDISATISNPIGGTYVKGEIYINVSVTNADTKVTGVQTVISGTGYNVQKAMTCPADFKCYTSWNTSAVSDGPYTLRANATNTAGKLVNDSISVTVDNTLPEVQIDTPASGATVGDMIYPRGVITDNYGVNPSTVRFNISNYSESMNCVQYVQGKKYVCGGNFNTTKLLNGLYNLVFYGGDLAGNFNSAARSLVVENIASANQTANVTNATTTTVAGSGATTTTMSNVSTPVTTITSTTPVTPTIPATNPLSPIINPLVLAFGDINKSLQEIFEPWHAKALAISMIIFLVVLAIFRNVQIIRFFKKGKAGSEEGQ